MKYYGIKTPENEYNVGSYIWWIDTDEHKSWDLFFQYNAHRAPLYDAIKAYEAIGYKCVELEIKEVEDNG